MNVTIAQWKLSKIKYRNKAKNTVKRTLMGCGKATRDLMYT